ncbi:unnamed protein product [Gordionus sp. m RMFG-2023]
MTTTRSQNHLNEVSQNSSKTKGPLKYRVSCKEQLFFVGDVVWAALFLNRPDGSRNECTVLPVTLDEGSTKDVSCSSTIPYYICGTRQNIQELSTFRLSIKN